MNLIMQIRTRYTYNWMIGDERASERKRKRKDQRHVMTHPDYLSSNVNVIRGRRSHRLNILSLNLRDIQNPENEVGEYSAHHYTFLGPIHRQPSMY